MSFVSLVVHGLSAISVYGDLVFVRLIVFAVVLAACSAVGLCVVVAIRLLIDARRTPARAPGEGRSARPSG